MAGRTERVVAEEGEKEVYDVENVEGDGEGAGELLGLAHHLNDAWWGTGGADTIFFTSGFWQCSQIRFLSDFRDRSFVQRG